MKREPMSWGECSSEHIRRVDYDKDKVQSMLKLCLVRLKVMEKIELDQDTASIIAEGLYEIIKEMLTALLLTWELKSDNHECLIAFFRKNYPAMEYEAQVIYELKSIRNAIGYEGLFVNSISESDLPFLSSQKNLKTECIFSLCDSSKTNLQ